MFDTQPWAEHMESMRPRRNGDGWQQGDHILIAAPTKSGKTEMASELAKIRTAAGGHCAMFITKGRDEILGSPAFRAWDRFTEWPPGKFDDLALIWPKQMATADETLVNQKRVYKEALDDIFRRGNRTVFLDELHYMSDPAYAGLARSVAILHHQGRSSGITMVDSTQRPAWIPKIIYSSVTHVYIARTRDPEDLKRLSNLGGVNGREVAQAVSTLPTRHDFLYLNPLGDRDPVIVNVRK
jgi:hypothetical protein